MDACSSREASTPGMPRAIFYRFTLTNLGAIYDPVANTWTAVAPPSFFDDLYPPRAAFAPNPLGDAPSIVLSDGTFIIEDKISRQGALLNLNTMTWTETGTGTKADMNDEEGLTLLPSGEVLTVDCYNDYFPDSRQSLPASGLSVPGKPDKLRVVQPARITGLLPAALSKLSLIRWCLK